MRHLLAVALLLTALAGLAACQSPPPPAPSTAESQPGAASQPASGPDSAAASMPAEPPPDRFEGTTVAGHYKISLELDPKRPPMGSVFSVVGTVTDAASGQPVPGATFKLDATMPEHKHGMTTQPRVSELGEGRYEVEGMKFHMPGRWELRADIDAPAGKDHYLVDYQQVPTANVAH